MSELPAPLVPAEIDLRSFRTMPLDGKRLFESDTWNMCDADEKIAALALWWGSWHQEPAGSLPDDDRLLAKHAGYGVAVRAFLKVKSNAMRGWIKCGDGRLYHPVVAEYALECWAKKRRKETENAADRERKRRKAAALRPEQAASNGHHPPDFQPETDMLSAGNPAGKSLKEKEKEKPEPNGSGERAANRGSRLPLGWQPSDANINYAKAQMLSDGQIAREVERFRNYWHAKPGKDGIKLDWDATWRNWILTAADRQPTSKTRSAITPMGPAGG